MPLRRRVIDNKAFAVLRTKLPPPLCSFGARPATVFVANYYYRHNGSSCSAPVYVEMPGGGRKYRIIH